MRRCRRLFDRIGDAVLQILIAALALICAATAAHAQQPTPSQPYPARPIRMMVPFSPGGASDTAARVVGQKLGERLGQQVIVDNRPGAGGAIGTELAVKAPADGYNLLMGSSTEIAINPHLYKKLELLALSSLKNEKPELSLHSPAMEVRPSPRL